MTKKRYGLEMDKNCYNCIVDIIDKKLYTDKKQIVDLLNELNDENKELKGEIYDWKASAEDYLKLGKSLQKENKELKDLLKSMADRNNEIWLYNGQKIRLKKVFNGEWINERNIF